MYLTALMQVTHLGCEIPRSKESPTNPLTFYHTIPTFNDPDKEAF